MTTIRLFYNNILIEQNNIVLEDKNHYNYIVNVMKRKVGDNIIFVNGKDGEFLGIILEIAKKHIIVKIDKKLKEFKQSNFLGLLFSPIQKIELLIKNAVELGITDFYPYKSQYTQYSNKLNRVEPNIIEAVEQCERLDLPTLHKEQKLKDILEEISKENAIIIFCEERSDNKLYDTLKNLDKTKKIYALVGGEGGFSEEEKQMIKLYKNVHSVSLGERILRAETATTYILSVIQEIFY